MSIYMMQTVDVESYEDATLDSYTKLLCHFDGNVTDRSGKTVTNNNVTFSTTEKKFGTGSAVFNPSNSSLTLADSDDWFFGSGDFTIDLWAKWSTLGHSCFAQQSDATAGYVLKWTFYFDNSAKQLKFGGHNPSSTIVNWVSGSFNPSVGTWYHLAVVKSGTTFRLFVNGTQIASATSSVQVPQVSSLLYIGRPYDTPFGTVVSHNGNIDEFRLSKGIARWTSNFTPPTAPHGTTTTLVPTNVNVEVAKVYRSYSGVNRDIKQIDRSYSGVNRVVFDESKTYMYKDGDERTSLTGGWKTGAGTATSGDYITVVNNGTHIVFATSAPYSWRLGRRDYVPNNKINLSSFSTLKMNISSTTATGSVATPSTYYASIYVSNYNTNTLETTPLAVATRIGTTGEVSLDVSGFDGDYYVCVECFFKAYNGENMKIDKIWLE